MANPLQCIEQKVDSEAISKTNDLGAKGDENEYQKGTYRFCNHLCSNPGGCCNRELSLQPDRSWSRHNRLGDIVPFGDHIGNCLADSWSYDGQERIESEWGVLRQTFHQRGSNGMHLGKHARPTACFLCSLVKEQNRISNRLCWFSAKKRSFSLIPSHLNWICVKEVSGEQS